MDSPRNSWFEDATMGLHGLTLLLLLLMVAGGCDNRVPPNQDGSGSTSNRELQAATYKLILGEPSRDDSQGQWPMWRGPRGDGISRETGWTAQWPSSGPKKLWQTSVGTGFSSVSVAHGLLYTMGNRNGNDTVYCFDAATGEKIWTHSYPCQLVDNLHEGGPGATPTVDGDRVYTVGREGQLFCLAANKSQVKWSKNLQSELGISMPDWGFTCSPLVLENMLILDAGRVVAYDKQSGKRIWQTSKYPHGYGAPVAFQTDGRRLIAVLNNKCLLLVRAEDGYEVASYPWKSDYLTNSTTPVITDHGIFISAGYDKGCTLLRLNGNQLEAVYENRDMRNHFNNSVFWQGNLYGFDGNSHSARNVKLVSMDARSGKVNWQQRGFGCGSLLVADGKLLVLSDKGELVTAAATPTQWKEISRAKVLSGKCWTVPVLAGGRIYCRNAKGDLVCLDVNP